MNSVQPDQKQVFYIPAGIPFVNALARAVLSGDLPICGGTPPQADELPNWTVLLPTRRATRALMQAFVDEGGGHARLLPNIQPLGDVDEDELSLSDTQPNFGIEPIPDAISGLERQFILFELIQGWVKEFSNTPLAQMLKASSIHGFDLARSLGKLVDSFETNHVDLKLIDQLFDGEFAEHRQQILGFLSIIKNQLPGKMVEMNKIGASDHRNRLMLSFTDFLESGHARGPVIAAGSTGSIPVTAQLLSCIASLKNGAVVLPGLDVDLDSTSWDCLPENHPQFGMHELLNKMGLARGDISILPGCEEPSARQNQFRSAQNWLISEIMRPADTTDQWRTAIADQNDKLKMATDNITILEAEDLRHEAVAISLIMRHGLEVDKTIALITPDRRLARNVKSELTRWEIEIDDSAGEPLQHQSNAIFMALLLDAARDRFSPVTLKSLLAHPFARFGLPEDNYLEVFTNFEIGLLRAEASYEGLAGLIELCNIQMASDFDNTYAHPTFKRLKEEQWQAIKELSQNLLTVLQPLGDLFEQKTPNPFSSYIDVHLLAAEKACHQTDFAGALWQGDAGEKLADLFAALQAAGVTAPAMTAIDYQILLEQQLSEGVVRPKHVRHGTLAIYGLLEARLISADIMILGGLNETVWPTVSDLDPWLTRPQLRTAGLPVPERRIGLSAHDFAQGFCGREVFLCYAKKLDNGPAVPSRWILRLAALLQAADLANTCDATIDFPWLGWAEMLDKPNHYEPVERPSPKPPLKMRPKNFSVTGIETLLKNPYGFFADKILRLKPLNSLEQSIGPAERGSLVHQALQQFIEAHHNQLPENAQEKLQGKFEALLEHSISDTSLKVFWRPQFIRMANWFIEQEKILRKNRLFSKVEISGQYSFEISGQNYQLSALADRLDKLEDKTYRIIDYKTGALPSIDQTAKSFSPQLLLEGLIARQGGFIETAKLPASELVYMKLSGGIPAGESTIKTGTKKINLEQMIDDAEAGMTCLVDAYGQSQQPYLANMEPEREDAEREYDFLSRWREWAHLSDDVSSQAGGSENE